MIVVDTNVFSEPLKPRGEQRVVDWLDRQPARGFAVATRDVRPFQAAGLEVINPWEN